MKYKAVLTTFFLSCISTTVLVIMGSAWSIATGAVAMATAVVIYRRSRRAQEERIDRHRDKRKELDLPWPKRWLDFSNRKRPPKKPNRPDQKNNDDK